jgi:hypothetical protein
MMRGHTADIRRLLQVRAIVRTPFRSADNRRGNGSTWNIADQISSPLLSACVVSGAEITAAEARARS